MVWGTEPADGSAISTLGAETDAGFPGQSASLLRGARINSNRLNLTLSSATDAGHPVSISEGPSSVCSGRRCRALEWHAVQSKKPPAAGLAPAGDARIEPFDSVCRYPGFVEPAALTRMSRIDLAARLDDEPRCYGTALPRHAVSVRFGLERVGDGPFETGPGFRRPAVRARRYGDEISRSRSRDVVRGGGCVVDVADIVADGRRVVPRARLCRLERIAIESANDFVAVKCAGSHRYRFPAFHRALPVSARRASVRYSGLRGVGGSGADTKRP